MLPALFAPRGIAVIGASRDQTKLGYGVARNLLNSGYGGTICFINPHADQILGQRCYASIEVAPDPIDLVVVIVPAARVPQTIEACGRRGIRWAIIVSGGFRETDRAGADLEEQIVAIARRYDLRLDRSQLHRPDRYASALQHHLHQKRAAARRNRVRVAIGRDLSGRHRLGHGHGLRIFAHRLAGQSSGFIGSGSDHGPRSLIRTRASSRCISKA